MLDRCLSVPGPRIIVPSVKLRSSPFSCSKRAKPSCSMQAIHAVSTAPGNVICDRCSRTSSQNPRAPKGSLSIRSRFYENSVSLMLHFIPSMEFGRLAGIKVAHSVRSRYVRLASAFPLGRMPHDVLLVSGPARDFA